MSVSHGYSTMGGIEYNDGGYVEKTKKREKERRDNYPFTTLVLQSSTMIFMIESLSFLSLSYTSGNFSL